MEISKLTEGQAMDMGITEAAIRQAESHAERSEALNPASYTDNTYAVAVAHAEALELNAQVVYVYGHGTRAYILKEVYADGGYVVRPLSGGMEWGFDRRAFGTVPFVACGCEHERHENNPSGSCGVLTPKGMHKVAYVGTVCRTCALSIECHGSM